MGFKDTEWAYSLNLKPMQTAVLAAVCHRTDDSTHTTIVGQQTIADMLGCDRATVLRSLSVLESMKIILRTPRNRRDGSKTSDTITVSTESYVAQSNVTESNVAVDHVAESRFTRDSLQQLEEVPSSLSTRRSTSEAAKRGTRLPDTFEVTPAMVAWARERTPLVDGPRATEKFINYWTAATGRNAVKLDWPATWRNWMLREQEQIERAPQRKMKPGERVQAIFALDGDEQKAVSA